MPKSYDSDYKEYVSRLVVDEGRSMAEVSRELDLSYTSVNRWVKDYKQKTGWVQRHKKKRKEQESVVYKTPMDYERELEAERKKIEQLERENKILKKAMHVFTENHENHE